MTDSNSGSPISIPVGSQLQLSGGTLSVPSGIINDGTVTGYGTIITGPGDADFEGTGSVIASGGILSFNAVADSSTAHAALDFSIDSGATLEFTGTVGPGATIDMGAGTNDVLDIASGTDFQATIKNFAIGDTISVANATAYTVDNSGPTTSLVVTYTGGGTSTINFDASYQASAIKAGFGTSTTSFTTTVTPCFAAGSRIRTERGDVPVEHLTEGDRVAVLRDGAIAYTPVIWTGHRRVNLRTHPQPQTAAPVRILRGAVGDNVPERDLVLSPDHCLFLDGKLIPAKSLINGMTIVQDRDVPAVHYFHVEVDPHAVLLAEGLPVESYLDTGNRACFQNCGAALVLHPEFTVNAGLKAWETHACAPLTVQPDAVQPIWQRLVDRAGSLGFIAPQPQTTREPGLHLLSRGRAIRPMAVHAGRYVFTLPAGCDPVRLVSRATIPSDLAAYREDWRLLGVAVSRIAVRGEGMHAEIPADHPGLMCGWHPVESDGATTWRWTDGNAELALDAAPGPVILEIQVCNTATYIVEAAARQPAEPLAA